jgi:hypothetical protein
VDSSILPALAGIFEAVPQASAAESPGGARPRAASSVSNRRPFRPVSSKPRLWKEKPGVDRSRRPTLRSRSPCPGILLRAGPAASACPRPASSSAPSSSLRFSSRRLPSHSAGASTWRPLPGGARPTFRHSSAPADARSRVAAKRRVLVDPGAVESTKEW